MKSAAFKDCNSGLLDTHIQQFCNFPLKLNREKGKCLEKRVHCHMHLQGEDFEQGLSNLNALKHLLTRPPADQDIN